VTAEELQTIVREVGDEVERRFAAALELSERISRLEGRTTTPPPTLSLVPREDA
jgi:hypothetical protein